MDSASADPVSPTVSSEGSARLLLATMRLLSRASSTERVAEIVRSAARELVKADGATFVLSEGSVSFYLDEDAIQPLWKGQRFASSECISGWAMLHHEQVSIPDIANDPRIPQELYRPTFVRSLVMTPVRKDDPVAAIGTYWASQHEATESELSLLQDLADAAALSLENANLVRNLERKVAARTEELVMSNKELESFAHVVAHDLRSPLSVVLGFATLIKEREALPKGDPAREHLEEILRAGDRMEALIGALLTYSRMARITLHPQAFNLSELASDVVLKLREKHPSLKVAVEIEPSLIAEIDPTQAELLLRHLLDNALKFCPQDGSAQVHVGRVMRPEGPVFFVRDNGRGFDPKHTERLFLPFQRFEQQRELAGTGVGLATCARIVRRHGGKIWAQSTQGKGASFFFTVAASAPLQVAGQGAVT